MRISDWSSDVCSSDLLNELGEIDRVEVQRGPQGTLGGRNSSAGLISIYSKKPAFEFGGTGEITYGNYDYWRLAGGVTGPISDTPRSEERRVGHECVSTGRSRWSPPRSQKNK